MSDKSSIEWTDATWNPIRGTKGRHHCVRISEGCKHCYAATMNHRFKGPDYVKGADTPRLDEEALLQPLKWKRPRRIFVCSMTDLFMDEHTDWMLDRVFATMALAHHHTFQVLTKRAGRMREYVSALRGTSGWDTKRTLDTLTRVPGRKRGDTIHDSIEHFGKAIAAGLPNVWLGVSAENQERADERIPDLLATPAAVRFVSAEPLLGPVNLERLRRWRRGDLNTYGAEILEDRPGLDWIIAGGESGPGARPCDVSWIRSIKDQCADAGAACFVKQLGLRPVDSNPDTEPMHIFDRKGGDMAEWPEDLRVREMPR